MSQQLDYLSIAPMVDLRLGLKELNSDLSYSLGFGLPIKISNAITLNCDYAIDPGLIDEGLSHLFSFTLLNY